jgi:hypothetical protein
LLYLAQEELDPLEMVEAINVLDRLPKEFFEKIVCFMAKVICKFNCFHLGIKTMERSKRSFG